MRDDTRISSASQIVTANDRGHEDDPIDEQEQLESELEDDEEAVIRPPTQYTFVPASRLARRALPIPVNAEFISIDDSDEETDLADQKLPKAGEVELQELQHEDVDEQNIELEPSSETDKIVEEDTTSMPPLDSAPPDETDIPIATWPPASFSDQQDSISTDRYESLYADIEPVMIQTKEQAGNYIVLILLFQTISDSLYQM